MANNEFTQDQLALIRTALQMYFYNTTYFNHSTTQNETIVMHEIDNIYCKLGLPPFGFPAVMKPSYFNNTFMYVNDEGLDSRGWLEPETEEYAKRWCIESEGAE